MNWVLLDLGKHAQPFYQLVDFESSLVPENVLAVLLLP